MDEYIDYDTIVEGSLAWKRLPAWKRQQLQSTRRGAVLPRVTRTLDYDPDNRGTKQVAPPNAPEIDDTQLGDIPVDEASRLNLPYTMVREFKGYKVARDTKRGMWHVLGLSEIGTFTDLQSAKVGLNAYLEKQAKAQQADVTS